MIFRHEWERRGQSWELMTYCATQWAAVRMWFSSMREPPQNCLCRFISAACRNEMRKCRRLPDNIPPSRGTRGQQPALHWQCSWWGGEPCRSWPRGWATGCKGWPGAGWDLASLEESLGVGSRKISELGHQWENHPNHPQWPHSPHQQWTLRSFAPRAEPRERCCCNKHQTPIIFSFSLRQILSFCFSDICLPVPVFPWLTGSCMCQRDPSPRSPRMESHRSWNEDSSSWPSYKDPS